MVLHGLTYTSSFSNHLIALKGEHVSAEGSTETVLTTDLIQTVFNMDCHIWKDQKLEAPLVVPRFGDVKSKLA